jgi:hypothetical protein
MVIVSRPGGRVCLANFAEGRGTPETTLVNMHHPPAERPPSQVIAVRFPTEDLDLIETAAQVMGDRNTSAFVRTSVMLLARCIVEASRRSGPPVDGWAGVGMDGAIEIVPKEDP